MLFPTLTFGLFFFIVFAVTWSANGSNEWRKILLLIASWIFYGAWDWRFVALLIGSAFLNWGAAGAIALQPDWAKGKRKAILIVGVIGNLIILGFFKYYGFFVEQLGDVLRSVGFQVRQISASLSANAEATSCPAISSIGATVWMA
jgi:D-alanyl-lipoteichoic acid acyltransferase DltB (MBOAT superfamily)